MRLLVSALTFISSISSAIAAPCPAPVFTRPELVQTSSREVLIVTHPSTLWDGRFSSKAGMDAAVQFAKARQMPVIYLQDSQTDITTSTYFFSDCSPTHWVSSEGGEFSFDVHAPHVYSVGGHWELCQFSSMNDLMTSWKKNLDGQNLTLTQVMDGLYTAGLKFKNTDSYFVDFARFMEIVFYGNPRDQWYIRKLNLLESMGIINVPAKQAEFLKRGLPDFSQFRSYQVELHMNGRMVEVLQRGTTASAPRLKFEFLNSLYQSGRIPAFR